MNEAKSAHITCVPSGAGAVYADRFAAGNITECWWAAEETSFRDRRSDQGETDDVANVQDLEAWRKVESALDAAQAVTGASSQSVAIATRVESRPDISTAYLGGTRATLAILSSGERLHW